MKERNKSSRTVIISIIIAILLGVFGAGELRSVETNQASAASQNSQQEVMSQTESTPAESTPTESAEDVFVQEYFFRNASLRNSHYEKHGIDMGFSSAEEYETAASSVAQNPDSLHKTEKEDGDDVYYLEETNEFVVVSTDGYLRTYFYPDSKKAYFDRQ